MIDTLIEEYYRSLASRLSAMPHVEALKVLNFHLADDLDSLSIFIRDINDMAFEFFKKLWEMRFGSIPPPEITRIESFVVLSDIVRAHIMQVLPRYKHELWGTNQAELEQTASRMAEEFLFTFMKLVRRKAVGPLIQPRARARKLLASR